MGRGNGEGATSSPLPACDRFLLRAESSDCCDILCGVSSSITIRAGGVTSRNNNCGDLCTHKRVIGTIGASCIVTSLGAPAASRVSGVTPIAVLGM